MKKSSKNLIYDGLHKSFVCLSLAVTVGGTLFLGFRAYQYFTIVRPLRKQLQLEQEQQLLREGMDPSVANNSQLA